MAILQVKFGPEHNILQFVHKETPVFLHHILLARSVAVVVDEQHARVILEEVVGIDAQSPGVGVIVSAHHPAAQLVALNVGIFALAHVTAAWQKGVPEGPQPPFAFFYRHRAVALLLIGCAAKLGSHLEAYFERQGIDVFVLADT